MMLRDVVWKGIAWIGVSSVVVGLLLLIEGLVIYREYQVGRCGRAD